MIHWLNTVGPAFGHPIKIINKVEQVQKIFYKAIVISYVHNFCTYRQTSSSWS